jgi:hopanoid biosynthesis associated radical SAM protein HpnH
MTLEECFQATEDCGAPIVSVCGGEPLVYPEIVPLVHGLIERRRHVQLCTNALGLVDLFDEVPPSELLSFNVHLDGMEELHDAVVQRKGTWKKAIEAIKVGKGRGYRMNINCTVFKRTTVEELHDLFRTVTHLGIDGILVSPGYGYVGIDDGMCMTRAEIIEKFRTVWEWRDKFPFMSTPLYMDFLRGGRDYDCTPWGSVTRNPSGWKAPCYLITDAHYQTWEEFLDAVDWRKYMKREDPRCANCMMHCGFEHTAVRELGNRPADVWTMVRWQLSK